jgi:hypothetical protein
MVFFFGRQARADLIAGPTNFGSVGGSDTFWGIQFTALQASTLTGFDYNHRNPAPFGNPISGTISLNDLTSNSNVYSYNYSADAPQVIGLAPNVSLVAGHVYQLVATSTVVSGGNDELFEYIHPFGTAPAYAFSDSDISVTQGAFSSGSFEDAYAWGAFTNIATNDGQIIQVAQSAPEPSSLFLVAGIVGLGGGACCWRRRGQDARSRA